MSEIKIFSMKTDSDKKLSEHFTVREFACHDGSDTVKIDMQLIRQLETIRAHFGGKPIHINSAYRTLTARRNTMPRWAGRKIAIT